MASRDEDMKVITEKVNEYVVEYGSMVPITPACTWWNRPEEDHSSGKLESTHPSKTSVKSTKVFGAESVMRSNDDSLLNRAATTSTTGTTCFASLSLEDVDG